MMEEESWVCVDESFSSGENFSDSDKVDSETEAELYSLIHFEGNLSSLNCQSSTTKNDTESDSTVLLSDKMKYILSTEKKEYNGEAEFAANSNKFLQNDINKLIKIENFDKTVSDNSLLKTLHENEGIFSIDHEVPTNFVNNSNSNQLTEPQSSNVKNKRKCDHSLPNYSSPPKKVANDSGRKNIWVDVDPSGKKDIQTNICEEDDDDDIVIISSDSETDHSTPSKRRVSPHQNMSMPNIKIGENHKDLWFVNQEDMSRARNMKARRYHDKVDITCSNCNRKGHHSKICPLPKSVKCFICGGEHIGTVCTNRMCGKCYGTGHDRRSCWMSHVRFCALCHMQGHIKENCPDLWRRYHLTTQPGKIVPDKTVKQNSSVFCCKCGRPGHYGAVCNFENRGYKNCFPTWPNVLSYDEPYSLPVQTSNTNGNKQNMEKKDVVIKRKKKILNEAEKLARRERIKRRKQQRQQLKRQKLRNSNEIHKVRKERDFPRTPKNNSTIPSSPRTQKNNSAINLFCPKTQKNNSAVNLSSPRTEKNNSAIKIFSPRMLNDSSEVTILPRPKIKKEISVIDLTSPKAPKNNTAIDLIPPKTPKSNCAFNNSSDLPESVRLLMLAKAKRREKNRKRKLKRRQNRLEREQSQNMST